MPPVDGAEYLTEHFFEVGPAPGGNPLTNTELRDWQFNSGIELEAFESQFLLSMSRAYLGTLCDAKKPAYPWPAKRPYTEAEEMAKARRLRRLAKQQREQKGSDA